MNSEDTNRTAIRFLLIIFIGSILAAIAGGVFGLTVSIISPEFVEDLFGRDTREGLSKIFICRWDDLGALHWFRRILLFVLPWSNHQDSQNSF